MTRQMIRQRQPRREDDTLGRNSPCFSLASKIALRFWIPLEQPQHTAVHLLQKLHPDAEHIRRYLVIVVETAEYEPGLREADRGTRWSTLVDALFRVVDLVTVRQINDLLGIE